MRKRNLAIIGIAGLLGVGGFTGVALASGGGGDDSSPITGDALKRASAVALQEAGGGHVTETEQGDEESYYQVEVTLDDGRRLLDGPGRNRRAVGARRERGRMRGGGTTAERGGGKENGDGGELVHTEG